MTSNKDRYQEGDMVIMHSLGKELEGREFLGRIQGIAVDHDGPSCIYIVQNEMDRLPEQKYSCVTMPAACLRRGH